MWDTLSFIEEGNSSYYEDGDWLNGHRLCEKMCHDYPNYLKEVNLGTYTFGEVSIGLRDMQTGETKERTFDERGFLLSIVQPFDKVESVIGVADPILSGKNDQEAWSVMDRVFRQGLRRSLPEHYSLFSYELRHLSHNPIYDVVLIGGVDGPSEPGGTVSYANFIRLVIEDPRWQELLKYFVFHIMPNANPLSGDRFSPYGGGGVYFVDGKRGKYWLVENFPNGNIGSSFDRSSVFEAEMIKKWVSGIDERGRVSAFISQHCTHGKPYIVATSNPQASGEAWDLWQNGVVDESKVTKTPKGNIKGMQTGLPMGVPAGYFNLTEKIPGFIIECPGKRKADAMESTVETMLRALHSIIGSLK